MVTSLNKSEWIQLGASVGLLYNAVSGLITGRAMLFHGPVRRAVDPVLFWTAITMSGGGGLALALMTLF